jgi:transposase-like protein
MRVLRDRRGERIAKESIRRGADHWLAEGGGGGPEGSDLCREQGISEKTFYRWRSKYSGLEVGNAKRVHQPED